jgi:hypothetical protein
MILPLTPKPQSNVRSGTCSQVEPQDWRHTESAVGGIWSGSEYFVMVKSLERNVIAQHIDQFVRLGHRLYIVEVKRIDIGKVRHHPRKTGRCLIEFCVTQFEPRQLCDPLDSTAIYLF